jgi:hypothetical protein
MVRIKFLGEYIEDNILQTDIVNCIGHIRKGEVLSNDLLLTSKIDSILGVNLNKLIVKDRFYEHQKLDIVILHVIIEKTDGNEENEKITAPNIK